MVAWRLGGTLGAQCVPVGRKTDKIQASIAASVKRRMDENYYYSEKLTRQDLSLELSSSQESSAHLMAIGPRTRLPPV